MRVENIGSVKQFIPQREPFIMISELCRDDKGELFTKFLITEDNIFTAKGVFQESGLIENIAQSAAAITGYNAFVNNEKIKKGFIGSVSNLFIHKLPEINQIVTTKIVFQGKVMNVNLIHGTVYFNRTILAECDMKIFLEE